MNILEALSGQWAIVGGDGEIIIGSHNYESLLFWVELLLLECQPGYIRPYLSKVTVPTSPLDDIAGNWIAFSATYGLVAISSCYETLVTQVSNGAFWMTDIVIGFVRPDEFNLGKAKI